MQLDFSKVIVRDISYAIYGNRMREGHYALMHKRRWADGIIFVIEGTAKYTFEDQSFSVGKNDVFYLANESRYDIEVGENYRVAYVDCRLEFADGVPARSCCFRMEENDEVDRLMKRMESKWIRNTAASRMQTMSSLYALFALLSQQVADGYLSSDNRRRVMRAGEIIEDKFWDRDFTCTGLGEELGMSEVHFRRLFNRYYGMTPNQFLTSVRIRKARAMLVNHSMSISEIAEQSGYHSVYYFCRAFKRETGYTPTEYRKNAL